jgi:hypothetical protein
MGGCRSSGWPRDGWMLGPTAPGWSFRKVNSATMRFGQHPHDLLLPYRAIELRVIRSQRADTPRSMGRHSEGTSESAFDSGAAGSDLGCGTLVRIGTVVAADTGSQISSDSLASRPCLHLVRTRGRSFRLRPNLEARTEPKLLEALAVLSGALKPVQPVNSVQGPQAASQPTPRGVVGSSAGGLPVGFSRGDLRHGPVPGDGPPLL